MTEEDREAASLAFARLAANVRRSARRSRRRANGSFDRMLAELESNAEALDGFAATLEMICETYGLTVAERTRNVEPEEEASPEEATESREIQDAIEGARA